MEPQEGNAQRSVEVTISGGKHSNPVFGNQTVNTDSVVHHHHGDDYPNATIHQHYYGPNQPPGDAIVADSPGAKPNEQTIPEGYVHLCDNIYLNNKEPLRRGMNVFHAFQQHANGQRQSLAIKVIFPCLEKNFREVECLLTLASHPNIVQIIRSEKRDIPAGFVLYIIMELCGDKNLQDYLDENRDSPLDYDRIMSFSKQLVDAVKHIHRNNIVHRDLKPENILLLLDGEHLKVTDFGISKELREGRSVTKQTDLAGTDGYRAPETLRDGSISKKADIFSLGIMLALLLLNGKHPHGEKVHLRNHNIIENIAPDISDLLIPGKEKDVMCSLLRRMLSPDPCVRPTIEEVFQDAFFTISAIQDLLSKLPRLVSGEAKMNGNGTMAGLSDLFQNTSSRRVMLSVISSDSVAPPATEIVENPLPMFQNAEGSSSGNMNNDPLSNLSRLLRYLLFGSNVMTGTIGSTI